MVAVVVNGGSVSKNLQSRFKYCTTFERTTGERFAVLRNDRNGVEADITFYGPDSFMSVAIRH